MILKDYMQEFRVRREEMAFRMKKSVSIISHWLAGTRRPSQKNAEMLEKETGGRVTVKESRGKDAREKA